jgi:ABC-2 type transport system ATP-binding protein
VVVDLDEPLAAPLMLRGVSVESTEAGGRRVTYALDGEATTAGDLVRRLAEVATLRDISVLEPDIEDVVARLYTAGPPRSGPPPGLDVTHRDSRP